MKKNGFCKKVIPLLNLNNDLIARKQLIKSNGNVNMIFRFKREEITV